MLDKAEENKEASKINKDVISYHELEKVKKQNQAKILKDYKKSIEE